MGKKDKHAAMGGGSPETAQQALPTCSQNGTRSLSSLPPSWSMHLVTGSNKLEFATSFSYNIPPTLRKKHGA